MRWLACLLLMSSIAYAEKPTLAVLGVVAKDQFSAKAADALTLALRTQASAKSSGYLVKGSPKQIKTAIMEAECSIDSASCASKLASGVGAEYAIAGDVERRGNRSIVVLALVDVKKKQRIRSVRETGADMKKLARTAYTRLVDAEAGELQLAANAQRGEIYIDGQLVSALHEGRATVTGLVNGAHRLVVKAPGFKELDVDITIEFTTKQSILLEPLSR